MVTFKMSHESAPARSSNILLPCPPKSRTPLPSGDSAIARPSPVAPLGKDQAFVVMHSNALLMQYHY